MKIRILGALLILFISLALASTVYSDEKGKTIALVENLNFDAHSGYDVPIIDVTKYKNISFLGRSDGPTNGDVAYVSFQFVSDDSGSPSGGPLFFCSIKLTTLEPCFISGDPTTKFTAPYPVTGPYLKVQIINQSSFPLSLSVFLYEKK